MVRAGIVGHWHCEKAISSFETFAQINMQKFIAFTTVITEL
jgi:hypothetical protein